MAESTLSVTLTTLRDNVTRALDFGYVYTDISGSTSQQGMVNRCIDRGYRMFLAPVPMGDGSLHIWSFMRPLDSLFTSAPYSTGTIEATSGVVTLTGGTFPSWAADGDIKVGTSSYTVASRDGNTQVTLDDTTIDVTAGTSYTIYRHTMQMSDDFGGIEGRLAYGPDVNYPPLTLTSEAVIRSRRSYSISDGYPRLAAVVPQDANQAAGHRFDLLLWPSPDAQYQLHYRKIVIVNALSDAAPYPIGGMLHGETLLAACLAVSEEFGETPATARRAYYAQRLAASVALDRQQIAPDSLGYNGDPSSVRSSWPYDGSESVPTITYNGIVI